MHDDGRDPDIERLETLLALMREHDLDRLKIRSGDALYEIVRRESAASSSVVPNAAAPVAQAESNSLVAGPNTKKIIAPLTGVFYRSASPDAEAFVDVGARVHTGDVLCILEAMKLFNEIQSDYDGTVARIVPENGELVSQGAELFWIEP